MTPKYFILVEGVISLCGRCRLTLVLVLLLCAKSISASFVYLRGELWFFDHSVTPPSQLIMSASLACALMKVLAVATMMVSSTYASASSFFPIGMSSKSAL